ncbi:CYP97B2 [Symbiodinium pilosum]|uniref:15-cis-phytoene synthase n=1 Tax=Symbiodinium pilosum TaxID=2952 RepID=A0A812R1M1_SYMPI|nr:CYP97B2 [Symbiodinium pilosum]
MELELFSITVLGGSRCGKTTLINAFVNNYCPTVLEETASAPLYYKTLNVTSAGGEAAAPPQPAVIEIEDTFAAAHEKGQHVETFLRMDRSMYAEGDAVELLQGYDMPEVDEYRPLSNRRMAFMLVFDCSSEMSLKEAQDLHSALRMDIDSTLRPVVCLVANRLDADTSDGEHRRMAQRYAKDSNISYFELSAYDLKKVKQLFRSVLAEVYAKGDLWRHMQQRRKAFSRVEDIDKNEFDNENDREARKKAEEEEFTRLAREAAEAAQENKARTSRMARAAEAAQAEQRQADPQLRRASEVLPASKEQNLRTEEAPEPVLSGDEEVPPEPAVRATAIAPPAPTLTKPRLRWAGQVNKGSTSTNAPPLPPPSSPPAGADSQTASEDRFGLAGSRVWLAVYLQWMVTSIVFLLSWQVAMIAAAFLVFMGTHVLAVSATGGILLAVRRTRQRANRPSASLVVCKGQLLDKVENKKEQARKELPDKPEVKSVASPAYSKVPPVVDARDTEIDGWTFFARFSGALWETFIDVATSRSPREQKGWEYRKGIEGMSMGSMAYEMMTTSEDTEEFKELSKEYQSGYGVPFLNLSFRKITAATRDFSKDVGLAGPWLTLINVLQTIGVSGDLIDGIPVQNKWINIVRDNLDDFQKQDPEQGQRQAGDLMQNMIMGRMERITGAPMPVFLEGYGESEGIYKIVIGPRSVVVVSDPVVVKRILTSSPELYTKGILTEVLEPIMGRGLIPADPETWRQRRRAIVPGFHKKWLKDATEQMVECAVNLADDVERSISMSSSKVAEVNMEEKFTSASLDIIGKAIFHYDFGSTTHESPLIRAVYNLLREAERRAQSVVPYWNLPGASAVFRDQKDHSENLALVNAVLDELIRNALEDPPSEDQKLSFLQFLVITKGEDVTTRQLRDDLMTLLIAGHETTAAMLTWTLFELVKPENAHFLREVQEEVDSVLQGRNPTFEELTQLPALRACLIEALRLYPEPPLLIRRCIAGDDVPVGPLCTDVRSETVSFLPGQDIFISTWSLQRSETLWGKDANSFNPHRWKVNGNGLWQGYSPEKSSVYPDERASDYAFLPFGAGSRKCVGDNFALLEAEAVLVALVQRFDFKAPPDRKVEMTTGATIHTAGGLLMEVSKRTDQRAQSHSQGRQAVDMKGVVNMEKKLRGTVAQRIEPEALVVPTARELRMLFTAQKEDVRRLSPEPELFEALEKAYKQCQEVTKEYSKTFYLGSQLLDQDEQRVVWAIYNWCRSTDELVDGPEAANTTMADLEEWEERLNRIFQLEVPADGDPADLAMVDSIRKFSLIQRPFQDMVGGMAMDLVKERYATFYELEVYCYRVAGTVGIMTLPVLGFDPMQNFTEEMQEETIAAAMSLGVAFQLTNILRDVGEDARRGRIYVPLEDLARFGISEDEVLAASQAEDLLYHEQKWKDFMEFEMKRCEEEYEKAKAGIVGLSEVNRLGVMAALYVYGDILQRIRENGYDNLSRRAYVPFIDKVFLMGKAWLKCQELNKVAQDNIRSGKVFTRKKEH